MPELKTAAPDGAHFEWEQVSNKAGEEFDVPILAWDDLDKSVAFYGEEGVLNVLDGTSLRVSFQNIARRGKQAKEPLSDEAIAEGQVAFRPGQRRIGEATPESTAARKARKAISAQPEMADAIQTLLDQVAAGTLTDEQKLALGLVR